MSEQQESKAPPSPRFHILLVARTWMLLAGCLMAHGSHLGDIVSVGDFKRASSFILLENYWRESERNRQNEISSNTGKVPEGKIKKPQHHFVKWSSEIQILSDLSTQVHGEGSEIFARPFWTPLDKWPARDTWSHQREWRPSFFATSFDFMSDLASHRTHSLCLPVFSKTDFIDLWGHNSPELAVELGEQRGSSRGR